MMGPELGVLNLAQVLLSHSCPLPLPLTGGKCPLTPDTCFLNLPVLSCTI